MQISDEMVDRALKAFEDACNSMVMCKRCDGRGYHHGFGEHGHDPDWCNDCGGCQSVPQFDDRESMRQALIAAFALHNLQGDS